MIGRAAAGKILLRPSLWVEAVRAAAAVAPAGWWRRPPFLPRPEQSYLAWRIHTAYGDATEAVTTDDIVAYLEWRKRQRSRG